MVHESGLEVVFFKRGDVDSLSMAVAAQLNSPGQRRRQVEHNFAAIQRNRPEATCRAYLQAFNLALENRRSPKRIAIPAPDAQMPAECA
jgi:hypothetical protein